MTKEEKTLLLALCAVLVSEAMEKHDRVALDRLAFLQSYMKPFQADVAELAADARAEALARMRGRL